MKTYEGIRLSILDRINRIRRIQRIVDTDEFQQAWRSATLEESKAVEAMIALNQYLKLQAWIDKKFSKTYDEMNLGELRALAKVHGIRYYASMNKGTLIWEILNADSPKSSSGNAAHVTMGKHTN